MRSNHPASNDRLSRFYAGGVSLRGWQAGGVCFLSGLGGNLGFAPLHLWPAYALALIVLIWMLDGAVAGSRPFLRRWIYASLFALGLIGGGWGWLSSTLLAGGDEQAVFGLIGSIVLQAGAWGLVVAVFALAWHPGPARIGVFCIAFYTAEWLRTIWCGGIIWNPPALVWAPGQSLSQLASAVGVGGLSALTISLFAAPAAMLDQHGRSLAMRVFPAVLVGASLGILWGWGAERLDTGVEVVDDAENRTVHTVRLIDASGAPPDTILREYLAVTGNADESAPGKEIVIWPEEATPHFLLQSTRYIDPIAQVLGNRVLITGAIRSEPAGALNDRINIYNSLAVLSADSIRRGPLAIHDASRLLPLRNSVPTHGPIVATGLPPVPIRVAGVAPFMPMIGAESLISWRLPPGVDRPEWLVHLSREQGSGSLFARQQSFVHARYRSIESGLPMARVSAGGASAIIDGFGRIVARIQSVGRSRPSERKQGVSGSVALPAALKETPFSAGWGVRFGVFFVIFNLSLFAWARS